MPVAWIAIAALLAVPSVTGGTDAQRKSVEEILKEVPDCLRSSDGKTPTVEIVPSDELNSNYDSSTDTIHVHDCLLDDDRRKAAAERFANDSCASDADIPADARRIVVHELAHYYYQHHLIAPDSGEVGSTWHANLAGDQPNDRARKFLTIRFEALWDVWSKSDVVTSYTPTLDELRDKIDDCRARKKPVPEALRKRFCELQDLLSKEYQSGGAMPERFTHDRHAFDGSTFGTEYFAIAIETMLFEPDAFCAAYSADEQEWLMGEIGECLAPMMGGRKPCAEPEKSTTSGGGQTR